VHHAVAFGLEVRDVKVPFQIKKVQTMRDYFSNGLEYVIAPRAGANVVSIQCVVWAGSLDERSDERGVGAFP
jgi:predicted Zn-dependent peptidase